MNVQLEILPTDLLPSFLERVPSSLRKLFDALQEAEISNDSFSFYTSIASVFSSKIEGEDIDLDSYIKHKNLHAKFLTDYTKKIDDLYNAYAFAQKNELNQNNIVETHKLICKHILVKSQRGTIRHRNMYVSTPDGKIEYVAASPFILAREMDKFYNDLSILLLSDLTFEEVFYHASMLHLLFVKIHPWNDGNGRCARLLEKWFLAEKLGKKAWFIQSEKFYYEQHQIYYNNIRLLGLEYPHLDYHSALPFLCMLPNSLLPG